MTDNCFNTNNTTAEGLHLAQQLYGGPWDIGEISGVFLPHDVAATLLEARGWRHGDGPHRPGPWISPTGYREWETDMALRLAPAAEALAAVLEIDRDDEQVLRSIVGAGIEADPTPIRTSTSGSPSAS